MLNSNVKVVVGLPMIATEEPLCGAWISYT